jgi:hypothetical protein
MVLPEGVKAVWDVSKAHREATATRERICINGLWRWQPAGDAAGAVPAGGWGYFKVPGGWPGITDYMQKDSQTLYAHPSWQARRLGEVTAAWYQREIAVPAEWAGRRIALYAEYVNSFAAVYVDGAKVGEIRFPAGEVDLTAACRPGQKHILSMCVLALPLKAVMLSYSDTAAAREVQGSVARRGLCGDVYLDGTPKGARLADVTVATSVRKGEIAFNAGLEGLTADAQYVLRAQVTDGGSGVVGFTSAPFKESDLKAGRTAFAASWKPERLWDINTPQNVYNVTISLLGEGGEVLDVALPERFGFREFWIDGKDFYLNGTRIYLSAVPLDNAQVGPALANYEAVRESLKRLKGFGINFVYTHNYGCEPGTHLSLEEELAAADDVGMLVALSQPHFGQYDWDAPDADQANGYARHAEFCARVAGSHPSVVFYSTSHNATGYSEDMNPDLIDGAVDRSDWGTRNVERALRAEAIITRLDPTRIVYHHSSGNLSSMHTTNFYANWAPVQEMSDWFEHWATVGVKPLFTCEFATPGTLDWTMYRGWYKGKRAFGNAPVPWEYCLAEWNAQFIDYKAYQVGEPEKTNIRWEAKQFRSGALWHRWDYPYYVGSDVFDECYPVIAMYVADNWRAFRTWGLSANDPWEYGNYWKLRDGVDKRRQDFKVDWDNLQRPGLSPDYSEGRYERMDLAFEASDWVPTAAAQALLRNNMPLLAYIGGKPEAFTSKDHNFCPGETVGKQLIVINNSRKAVTAECRWSLGLPRAVTGTKAIALPTGQQERIPLSFELPANAAPGRCELKATVVFDTGETQDDVFAVDVISRALAPQAAGRIALFDPKGETGKLLDAMGVRHEPVQANADLSAYDTLIVGKGALTLDHSAPDISRVWDGLRVVIFEQTGDVLEKRFGFRIAEYGLRWVFRRVPDHPLLAGIGSEHLWNWRGEATTLPPRGTYQMTYHSPMSTWCDIPVTQLWRCGNRGNVASALIEKPACGDFLPILDGGYALQYTPLMEYREGRGMVLFCQMDVTGRTESDPAAERLARNIVSYVSAWKPSAARQALYMGDPAGRAHLERASVVLGAYGGGALSADQVLVVGPGGGHELAASAAAVSAFLRAGGHVLAAGLSEEEANAFLPMRIRMDVAEHIAACFEPAGAGSPLAGISPAEVYNRDPRQVPLVSAGARAVGDGVLAVAGDGGVVFCQLVPWQFDYSGEKMNVKRTFRRVSCLMTRLLGNMGVGGQTPLLGRFSGAVAQGEQRWLKGFYLDAPEECDYPYRFFRW